MYFAVRNVHAVTHYVQTMFCFNNFSVVPIHILGKSLVLLYECPGPLVYGMLTYVDNIRAFRKKSKMLEMENETKNYKGFLIHKIWQILKRFSRALKLSIKLLFLKSGSIYIKG